VLPDYVARQATETDLRQRCLLWRGDWRQFIADWRLPEGRGDRSTRELLLAAAALNVKPPSLAMPDKGDTVHLAILYRLPQNAVAPCNQCLQTPLKPSTPEPVLSRLVGRRQPAAHLPAAIY